VLLGVSENLVYQKATEIYQKWGVKNNLRRDGIIHYQKLEIELPRAKK
jgi:hypothetical protein